MLLRRFGPGIGKEARNRFGNTHHGFFGSLLVPFLSSSFRNACVQGAGRLSFDDRVI